MKLISELNSTYNSSDVKEPTKIKFLGVDGFDVYNITAPFENDGKTIIAGRVEKRDSEDSNVLFFEKQSEDTYSLVEEYPKLHLQDPYMTFIKGELVLGGTKIFPSKEDPSILDYNAVKYRGKNIQSLEPFFDGPSHMKDIRLVELNDGRILCLTRPQGEYGGRGKIGYLFVNSLEELNKEDMETAPLLGLFDDSEWGGANEIHVLDDNTVGILGHIARFDDEGNRHYHAISFKLDINTIEITDLKIILLRKDLLKGDMKRTDLEDVIFSGGIILEEETAKIYVGVSDAEAHYATISNPFREVKNGK